MKCEESFLLFSLTYLFQSQPHRTLFSHYWLYQLFQQQWVQLLNNLRDSVIRLFDPWFSAFIHLTLTKLVKIVFLNTLGKNKNLVINIFSFHLNKLKICIQTVSKVLLFEVGFLNIKKVTFLCEFETTPKNLNWERS